MPETNQKLQVQITILSPNAKMPTYAHEYDAGFDLYSTSDVTLNPKERALVPTGISMAIPKGYVGLVWDKSGVAKNFGITTLGGVIDSQYRGEIQVILLNTSTQPIPIDAGQKIAQMLLQKVEQVEFVQVEALDQTTRGDGGFGSSGR
jgi:dUTP pyrophosphatase